MPTSHKSFCFPWNDFMSFPYPTNSNHPIPLLTPFIFICVIYVLNIYSSLQKNNPWHHSEYIVVVQIYLSLCKARKQRFYVSFLSFSSNQTMNACIFVPNLQYFSTLSMGVDFHEPTFGQFHNKTNYAVCKGRFKEKGWMGFLKKFKGYNDIVVMEFTQIFNGRVVEVGCLKINVTENLINKVTKFP